MESGHRRIAAVPFTLRNLKEEPEDVGSRFDGAPDLEFRLATEALELEQSGLSHQRVPPGYRFPYGHARPALYVAWLRGRAGGPRDHRHRRAQSRRGSARRRRGPARLVG